VLHPEGALILGDGGEIGEMRLLVEPWQMTNDQ